MKRLLSLIFPKTNRHTPFRWIAILTLVIIFAMSYSFHTGRSVADRYTPLMEAVLEIKLEATTAHLWFEEIISGDQSIDINIVWKHLDKAEWYAQVMLTGGKGDISKYVPLEEPNLREMIIQAMKGLKAFRVIAEERWELQSQSGVGSDIDQRFDDIFKDLIKIADEVKIALQQAIQQQLQYFYLLQGVLIALIAALGFVMAKILQRHERNRIDYLLSLEESNTQVHLLLDSTAEAIYGIDINGKCTFVNQSCLDLLGYENEKQLLGMNMHDLMHHSYADGSHYPVNNCHIFKAFLENTETHIDDEVLWRKDGSCFDAEYWSHPIIKEGKCVGAVVTFLDISIRRKYERALAENENNLAITLNSIGDAVIATDANGNVIRMNPIAEQLTGWALKEARGLALENIFSIVSSDKREPLENPVARVLATGEIIHLSNHTTLISKNGKEYQIADSAAPIRDGEDIIGIVLVFNDITEQYNLREVAVKHKRDLQAIMDHLPAVIYVKDTNGRFTFINQRFEQLFHIKRTDIINKTLHDIFPEDLADEMKGNDKIVLATGDVFEAEECAPHDDGIHTYASVKFPLFNEKNEIYAVCGISTDITERKDHEKQLRRSQKMDALGKLTGGIAHDYNNILGIVLGYAEQINSHLDDADKVKLYSANIVRAAERGSKLAKKLLSFSLQKDANVAIVDINSVLQEQQHMLSKTLTAKIKLSLELDDNLWPVKLDSSDFEDAIVNISINALHAMESNGQLTIRTSNIHIKKMHAKMLDINPGDYVLLSITDTGCGMDEKTCERIFDPFYTTKGEQGTGLGLSQVYGFVERSNGVINVHSELNKGSRFTLHFPRCMEAIISTPNIVPTPNPEDLSGNEKILVVDDEPAIVTLTYDMFTEQGYHVLTASDGERALAVLEKETVDLIISDIIMPNMDGFQLANEVQQRYPNIKIQLVSGFADERNKEMVEKSLYENILYKPFMPRDLLLRVKELFSQDKEVTVVSECTVLIMDDEEDILELYKINLNKLGCNVITVSSGEEVIDIYKAALGTDNSIDVIILDLTIPDGMGGKQVASKIRDINPDVKIIVSSGDSGGLEMMEPQEYGFDAAIEKDFNFKKIKQVLDKVLMSD